MFSMIYTSKNFSEQESKAVHEMGNYAMTYFCDLDGKI